MKSSKYRRIILKISGESMKGKRYYGIDQDFLTYLAEEIKDALATGVQIAIVPGGGNIFRGLAGAKEGMDRATADYMGMLATVFNSLALQDALEKIGIVARVQTSIAMKEIAEPYIRQKANAHLEKGRVIILGAGTGLPYITTDTAAALRGLELKCDAVFKATKVDGIYDDDPMINSNAKMFKKLTYNEILHNDKIFIMDDSAISLCKNGRLSLVVFNINTKGNLRRVLIGEPVGTVVN